MSAEITVSGFVQRVTNKQIGPHTVSVVDVKVGRKVKKDGAEAWENDYYKVEFWNADAAATQGMQERDRIRVSGMLVPGIYQPDGKPARLDLKVKFPKVLPLAGKTDGAIAGRMAAKTSGFGDDVAEDDSIHF